MLLISSLVQVWRIVLLFQLLLDQCSIHSFRWGPTNDPTLYRQPVRILIYLTVARHDLAYVIHLVSQFIQLVTLSFCCYYTQFMVCQGNTISWSPFSPIVLLYYVPIVMLLDGWSDWSSFRQEFCFFLGDSYYWRSKKQPVIACSTTESDMERFLILTGLL